MVIANAGVMATPFGHTVDGFETQFGTNHLGHFVLINRIAPLIRAGGRLINLSSSGHRFSNVDLEDPNLNARPTIRSSPTAGRRQPTFSSPLPSTSGIAGAASARQPSIREASRPNSAVTWTRPAPSMIDQMNQQLAAEGKAPFEWKTIPQGAATSVWAGFIAPADEVGGRYCENCHVGTIVRGRRGYQRNQ